MERRQSVPVGSQNDGLSGEGSSKQRSESSHPPAGGRNLLSASTSSASTSSPAKAIPARRARSIHINVKPEPKPSSSSSFALPSWLSGALGSSSTSSGSSVAGPSYLGSPLLGTSSSFAMMPNRSMDGSVASTSSNAGSVYGHPRRPSSVASASSVATNPGSTGRWSTRFAGTVRNQLRKMERDGIRNTLFPIRSQGRALSGDRRGSALSDVGNRSVWNTFKTIPGLLFVGNEESGSTAAGASRWHYADDAGHSSDGSGSDPNEKATTAGRRASKARNARFRQLSRSLDSLRRKLGMGRAGFLILLLLLACGLYEMVFSSIPRALTHHPRHLGLRFFGRNNPFQALQEYQIPMPSSASAWTRSNAAVPIAGDVLSSEFVTKSMPASSSRGTTAILLNWKRQENLVLIVAHLCAYSAQIFDQVQVWNNNPNITLTQETFAAARCPRNALQIYNSPSNVLFLGRFLACAHAITAYCYFQDDDWLVPSLPAVHAQFMRNPEGPPVIATGDEFPMQEAWEWCFFNTEFHLASCFAWLGTGSFVSRARVLAALDEVTSSMDPSTDPFTAKAMKRDELAMLDNAFTTLQNEPPYVIDSRLVPMASQSKEAFSRGSEGDYRNELYIERGLDRLTTALQITPNLSPYPPPVEPWAISTTPYRQPKDPAYLSSSARRHPYQHHTRAASFSSDLLFMTNAHLYPPPDSIIYQTNAARNLSVWQRALGDDPALWKQGKDFALAWPYYSAVDGDAKTAFRSPDIVRKDDYIGLDLLAPLDIEVSEHADLHFILEHSEDIVSYLRVEVSLDGYTWLSPSPRRPPFSCRSSQHFSTMPLQSFPNTFYTSKEALNIVLEQNHERTSAGGRGWLARKARLDDCRVQIGSSVSSPNAMGVPARKGWRFVRLRSEADMHVGWGVYEMWVAYT